MNRAEPNDISPFSSQESLEESEKKLSEIECKKKTNTKTNRMASGCEEESDEIEISGSKEPDDYDEEDVATACTLSSRTESMARDVRRLKSATLDRMGKILKIHSKSTTEKLDGIEGSEKNEESKRKQKFNSLTRMLRLSDKEDNSKTPGQYRGRSLTRILRKKVPIEADNLSDKPQEQQTPGIFSRIIGHIRARVSRNDASNNKETPSKSIEKTIELPISPSDSALSELHLESSSPIVSVRQQV